MMDMQKGITKGFINLNDIQFNFSKYLKLSISIFKDKTSNKRSSMKGELSTF
jgi:hypothetical protein